MYSNAPKGINWRSKFHKFSRHHIAGEGDLRQAAAAALRMLSLNPVNILDNFFTPVWISPTASTPTPETLSGISTDLRTQHWSSSAYVASLTNRPLTLIATAAYNPPTAEPSPPSSSPECQRPANGSLSVVAQRDLINLAGAYSTTYDGPLSHWAVPRGTERAPRYDIGNVRSKHRREASLVYRAEPKQRKKHRNRNKQEHSDSAELRQGSLSRKECSYTTMVEIPSKNSLIRAHIRLTSKIQWCLPSSNVHIWWKKLWRPD